MSTKSLPLVPLADWCRALRVQLDAGVPTTRVFASLAERGPAAIRPLSSRLRDAVASGQSIGATLEADGAGLPRLFVPMAQVGDETGHLPEVLGELEDYLRDEERLRREIRRQTMLPRMQFFAAIFIVAGVIFILGIIAGPQGNGPRVLGLAGTGGALLFLAATLGPIVLGWLLCRQLTKSDAGRRRMYSLVTRVPALGAGLFSLAMSRFALALQLTLDSSLSPAKALRLSFAAADDAELVAQLDEVLASVRRGESLSSALAMCSRLPPEFQEIFATAEEAGSIPEAMRRQSRHYRQLAVDQFNQFAQMASFGVRFGVIAFIVLCIFSLARIYINAIGG
jgi:type II secretory pathway component PulF